jgi:hypothetical protein
MTVIETLDGRREVVRSTGGVILSPHGPLGSGAWVLSDQAAGELAELLSGLTNDSRPQVLGGVEALTNIGTRSLLVVLVGAAVEIKDVRKLSVIRWTLRMVDQVAALHDALVTELAAVPSPDAEVVPVPIDPDDVPLPEGPRVMRTTSVRDRVR